MVVRHVLQCIYARERAGAAEIAKLGACQLKSLKVRF